MLTFILGAHHHFPRTSCETRRGELDALQGVELFLHENQALLTGVDFTAARKRLADEVTRLSTDVFD